MPKHRRVVQDMLATQLREYEGIKDIINILNHLLTFFLDLHNPEYLTYFTQHTKAEY